MKTAVIWLWVSFLGLFVTVLLLGFIQNPTIQSLVALGFFLIGFPLFLTAVGFSVALLVQTLNRKSKDRGGPP